jgi:hypothetical protein
VIRPTEVVDVLRPLVIAYAAEIEAIEAETLPKVTDTLAITA